MEDHLSKNLGEVKAPEEIWRIRVGLGFAG